MTVIQRTIPLRLIIEVSGVDVNGTDADTGFTSDPIKLENKPWSLNVWFDNSFAVTGQDPNLTIEYSNDFDGDVNSFNPLEGFTAVDLPDFFDSLDKTSLWIRFVYDEQGVTAGDKHFDLLQIVQ